jgi:hypothetical protein
MVCFVTNIPMRVEKFLHKAVPNVTITTMHGVQARSGVQRSTAQQE